MGKRAATGVDGVQNYRQECLCYFFLPRLEGPNRLLGRARCPRSQETSEKYLSRSAWWESKPGNSSSAQITKEHFRVIGNSRLIIGNL